MAENNDLKVIVGLDIPKSVVEIEGDLKIIEKALAKSDEGKLKITAGLNVGKTIGIINKQLSELKIDGSRLKITPTLDIDFGKQLDDDIVNSTNFTRVAQNLKKQMDLVKEAGKSVTDELTKQLRVISENFDKEPQKVENAFAKIEKIYNDYSKISRKTTADRNQDISNLSTFFINDAGINKSFNHATTISKYWYDRVVNAYGGDENEARKALREAFGKYLVLAENESRSFAVKFDAIFRDYTETDSQGKTITYANSQENTFKQYVEARKQAYSWTKEISKEEMQNERERLASIRESILALLNLVKVNEQVAQSQRDIAQAQKEVQNTTRKVSANGTDDILKRKGELANQVTVSELNILKLEQQIRQEEERIVALKKQISDAYVFDDTSNLENQLKESEGRLEATKKILETERNSHTTIENELNDIVSQIKDEKQKIKQAAQVLKSNFDNASYISNNQVKDKFDSIAQAEEYFKNLGVGKVSSVFNKGELQNITDFTIKVQGATGVVEKFRYAVENVGDDQNPITEFQLKNINAANEGILRLIEAQEKASVKTEEIKNRYTRLLADFKSSNSAIESGLTKPIQDFETVLTGLGKTHSIEDVKNQFEKLKTSAAEISKYLDTTNNSFNKTRNAINNYNQMDDSIKKIEVSYGNLVVKNDELGKSVGNLRAHYSDLVKLQETEKGYTVEWAKAYQSVNAELKEVRVNVEAAVRAESNSQNADRNSQYQIQTRHLKSIIEAQKQIVQLSRQRLSADEAETAELDRQIKNARQRIRDNTTFLVDKDLYSGVAKQIADSTKAMDEQLKLIGAKQTDNIKKNYQDMSNAISKTVEKLKSLQSQPLFKTKGNSGVTQLSVDIKALIKDYEKLQKSMMGSTPNSQNLDHFAEKLVEIDQRSKTVQATFGSLKTSVSESAKAEALAQKEADKLAQSYTQMSSTIANATTEMVKLKQSPILGDSTNTEYVTQFETEIQKIIEDYNALYQAMNKNGNQTPANYEIFSQELAKISQRAIEVKAALDGLKADNTQQKQLATNFDNISKSVEKVITDLNAMSRTQIFNTHSNNAGVIEFQDKIKSLSDVAKQVKTDLNALGDNKAIPLELKTRVDNLTESFKKLEGSNKTLQANLRQNDAWTRTERQIQTLTARIKEYMAVNTKAAKKYSSNFDGLLSGLSQAEMNKDSEAVRRLSADFQILQHEIKAAGDQGKTFGQTIVENAKRFSSWMTLTGVISTGWRELRKMVNTVIELDTAMTNLRKVTNETEGTYSKFLKNATTQAKELGMAVTDLIDSTSDFAKLGYSLPDATELAKVASVYANVGELNISDATSSLVSTLAAFKMEAKDAMSVIDKFNAIGNSFSITSADIGEALQRSASSLHTANNTLDESIALITAAKQYWLRIWKHIYRIHLTALIA